MGDLQTVPDEWLRDIKDALENPDQFKYTGWGTGDNRIRSNREANYVIPAELIRHYDRFQTRALAHSKTKGEHEAAGLLNFFIIYKYRLWRAEYKSWDEYVRNMATIPFSIAATTIKTGVLDIDKLLGRGMDVDNVIKVMGLTRTAAKMLATVPDEQLPGKNLNAAAGMIVELGPGEAIAAVNDWTGKATYRGLSAIHDATQERLYIEVKRARIDGSWDKLDWQINMIDADAANWVMERCAIPTDRRVFK